MKIIEIHIMFFNVTVKSVDISRECDFDIKRIDYGLTNKKTAWMIIIISYQTIIM